MTQDEHVVHATPENAEKLLKRLLNFRECDPTSGQHQVGIALTP
jgi:hypothetical protein